jgi:hypothetical protein
MSITEDPYFAGPVADKAQFPDKLGPGQPPPILPWLVVYVVNLIVPLILAVSATNQSGKVGMGLGILLVFALGCRLCFVSRRAVLTVVYGGWVVAAAQLFPLLQICAGIAGIRVASALSGWSMHREEKGDSVLGGFLATVVTGALLLTVATVLGRIIQGLIAVKSGSVAIRSEQQTGWGKSDSSSRLV